MPSCPICGSSLPIDAPAGLCPRCLMGAGLSTTGDYQPATPGRSEPVATVDFDEARKAVIDLGLATGEEIDALADQAGGDVRELAKALVRDRKLTPYQAGALVQGKSRGLRIGRYLVLGRLGAGGMGVVLQARHRTTGQVVALKILPPSFSRDGDAVRRFRREFQVATHLKHPNLVAAIEADEDRGIHFLAMEFVPGRDLAALVEQDGPLAVKLALHCAIQIARGLEAAHAQGVVHRDIKPSNVMIDASGNIRVCDMGLARILEATGQFGQEAGPSLTRTGAYMGTVDFLAPEQADDAKKADRRADVYSLGCTLYFLLTGQPPFPGDTILKRLIGHQEKPAPSLRDRRPEVPPALEGVYQRMMAKRPADRPQTMTDVIAALEACRSNPREAGDASADLKAFATTFMKRAAPKKRGPDASIFARPGATPGLRFGPDLKLEDVIGDYKGEAGHEDVSEEKPPPPLARTRIERPRGSRGRRFSPMVPLAVLVVVAAFWMIRDRGTNDPNPPGDGPDRSREVAAKPQGVDPTPAEPISPPTPPSPGVDPKGPSAEEAAGVTPGFVSLFNGKDRSGWITEGQNPEGWKVEGGEIVSTIIGGPLRSYLLSLVDYSDFALKFEYSMSEEATGGFVFRATPGEVLPGREGIENAHPFVKLGWNNEYGPPGTMRFVGISPEPTAEPILKPPGQWNTCVITVRKDAIVATINDTEVRRAESTKSGRLSNGAVAGLDRKLGRIGFSTMTGTWRFRKIEVRDLGPVPKPPQELAADGETPGFVPLFNGKNLVGWSLEIQGLEGGQRGWGVEDGAIVARLKGAPKLSYLMSNQQYQDFTIQFEYAFEKGADGFFCYRAVSGEALKSSRGIRGLHPFVKLCGSRTEYGGPPGSIRFSGAGSTRISGVAIEQETPLIAPELRPPGEWNSCKVTLKGRVIKVAINGQGVLRIECPPGARFPDGSIPGLLRPTGNIGFSSAGTVRFRKIEIRELDAEAEE
ncbi:MAG: family 16 glycoside hydrolase [Isosphaeraceae bacterium]